MSEKKEVFLTETAFISMVTAVVEAYPQETLGVLFGLRKLDKIWVQHAIVYQTAERKKQEVSVDEERKRRMDKFLSRVTHLEIIGDFHSHPERDVLGESYKLSPRDKNDMEVKSLGIVIVAQKDGENREWEHFQKGSLCGSVYPYSLRITSWFKSNETKYEIAEIYCPFALGLKR